MFQAGNLFTKSSLGMVFRRDGVCGVPCKTNKRMPPSFLARASPRPQSWARVRTVELAAHPLHPISAGPLVGVGVDGGLQMPRVPAAGRGSVCPWSRRTPGRRVSPPCHLLPEPVQWWDVLVWAGLRMPTVGLPPQVAQLGEWPGLSGPP